MMQGIEPRRIYMANASLKQWQFEAQRKSEPSKS